MPLLCLCMPVGLLGHGLSWHAGSAGQWSTWSHIPPGQLLLLDLCLKLAVMFSSTKWETTIQGHPGEHISTKGFETAALEETVDSVSIPRTPWLVWAKVGSWVWHPAVTALQKAVKCELETLKYLSFPLGAASVPWELATNLVFAATWSCCLAGLWDISMATLSCILDRLAPNWRMVAPLL